MNSISKQAHKCLSIWKDDYYVEGKLSGNALFKVIICKSGLNTKATFTYLHTMLATLGKYLPT